MESQVSQVQKDKVSIFFVIYVRYINKLNAYTNANMIRYIHTYTYITYICHIYVCVHDCDSGNVLGEQGEERDEKRMIVNTFHLFRKIT
jgi:hypothetical protein